MVAVQQLTLDDLTQTPAPSLPTPTSEKAVEYVRDGLTSCLGPGVPLMGEIVSARFTGKDKAVATLTMFDGKTGIVEVSKWTSRFAGAWSIAWKDTGNSPCHWNGSAWERLPEDWMERRTAAK